VIFVQAHQVAALFQFPNEKRAARGGLPLNVPEQMRTIGLEIAATEAAALIAEADVAAAAVLAARFQALAHRLQHVAALAVAAAAGERAAFLGLLVFAFATGQIEAAHLQPIAHAAARAIAIANRIAQNLKILDGQRIITTTANAKATHKLLKREFTGHRIAHVELRIAEFEFNFRLFWKLRHHVTGHNSHSPPKFSFLS
jgi:hypothetical protein